MRDEVNVHRDWGHHESHKRLSAFVWDTSSRHRVPRTSTRSHAFRPTLSEDLAPPELRRCEPGLCGRQARQAPFTGRVRDFFAAPAGEHNRADASRVRRRRQPRRVQAPWHVAPHQNQQNPTSRTRLPRTPRLRVVAVGSPLPPPLPPRPLLRSSRSRRLLQTLSPPQVPAILALSSPRPRPSRSLQRIRRVVVAGSSPPRRPLRRSRPLSSTWPVTRSASPMSQRMLS